MNVDNVMRYSIAPAESWTNTKPAAHTRTDQHVQPARTGSYSGLLPRARSPRRALNRRLTIAQRLFTDGVAIVLVLLAAVALWDRAKTMT